MTEGLKLNPSVTFIFSGYGTSLEKLEAEVLLDIPAAEFSKRATKKIPVDQARATLNEMGINVPHNIPTNRLSGTLEETPKMTDGQIREFLNKFEE